jgi:hypothetical protein
MWTDGIWVRIGGHGHCTADRFPLVCWSAIAATIRPCCNPDHLFLGTNADNMADMHAKGRGRVPRRVFRGEHNPCARLTERQVSEIRDRYRRGNGIQLAHEYGVSSATISLIVNGKMWAHVTPAVDSAA